MGISEEELSDQKALETWGPSTWPSLLPHWEPSAAFWAGLFTTLKPCSGLSMVVKPKRTVSPLRGGNCHIPQAE